MLSSLDKKTVIDLLKPVLRKVAREIVEELLDGYEISSTLDAADRKKIIDAVVKRLKK